MVVRLCAHRLGLLADSAVHNRRSAAVARGLYVVSGEQPFTEEIAVGRHKQQYPGGTGYDGGPAGHAGCECGNPTGMKCELSFT